MLTGTIWPCTWLPAPGWRDWGTAYPDGAAFPKMLLIAGKRMEISCLLVSSGKTELVAFVGNSFLKS